MRILAVIPSMSAIGDHERAPAMTVEELRTLYDYGYWANRQLAEVLSKLTADEFTRPLAGGHASIRNSRRVSQNTNHPFNKWMSRLVSFIQ